MFNFKKNTGNNNTIPVFLIVTGCAGSGKTSLGKTLAKKLKWTYIDKDTVTRYFTDYILTEKGSSKGDRESDLYCNEIRPIEYKITFKTCMENLEAGNNVILTIPFIAQIKDYSQWEKLQKNFNLELSNARVKFLWIKHDEGNEYIRIIKRAAERDNYKIKHWDEYLSNISGITPDPKYDAYVFDNDSNSVDNMYIEDVIQWIKK